jgi:hypothetical protein
MVNVSATNPSWMIFHLTAHFWGLPCLNIGGYMMIAYGSAKAIAWIPKSHWWLSPWQLNSAR